jgi:chaperonin cofactor prefoldin
MGSTLDFFGATIADALSPRFRRPVEDIIYETIDRKQIPTRTDFTELRNTINSLRSQSTGAQKGVEKLKGGLDDIEESIHELTTRLSDLESQNKRLASENAVLKATLSESQTDNSNSQNKDSNVSPDVMADLIKRIESLESKKENIVMPKSKASKTNESCKVPGCNTPVRASGFCNSCYGKCRRGTLKGFVSFTGVATASSGEKFTVSKELGGHAFTEQDGNILVDSKIVATR